MSDHITEIGKGAFYGCSALTEAIIPNSVNKIDAYAFYGCSGITKVILSNSLTSIENFTFHGCSALTEVTIPNSVKDMESMAFGNCVGLTSVTIPNSVIEISFYVFAGCSKLKDVISEDSYLKLWLDTYTFDCCPIETVYLGRNISYSPACDKSPFNEEVKTVLIGNLVTSINNTLFYNCTGLTSITFPGSIREIKDKAFEKCTNLTKINLINPIPAVIEKNTFTGCEDKAILNVPADSRNIYWIHPYWGKFKTINAMNSESGESFVSDNITYHITSEQIATVEVSAANFAKSRTGNEVLIPEKVTYNNKVYTVTGIANNGFKDADITEISLPATISYVGLNAFKGCCDINSIKCWTSLPPAIESSSFEQEVYNKAILKVDSNVTEAYKDDALWGKFQIKELGAVEEIENSDDDFSFSVYGGSIRVNAPEGNKIEIYNMSGNLVRSTTDHTIDGFTPGIYILCYASRCHKVLIR